MLFYPLHQLLEVKNGIHCRTDLAPSRLPFALLGEETVRDENNLPWFVILSYCSFHFLIVYTRVRKFKIVGHSKEVLFNIILEWPRDLAKNAL